MGKVLIVGCGGVASVAVHKCCQNSKVFDAICIASRTVSKCEALKEKLQDSYNGTITTAQVDADNTEELIALIEKEKPDVVLNLALPYQDLTIMDACLATGVDYVDTANYEPEDTAKFEYKWQWAYREKYEKAGITALLGSGFDPGVTGVFSAYALKHYFDEINYIDILDCNGGDHGYPFATNFNPEINIREVSAKGSYWEDGHWVETEPMEIKREYDFPEVGMKDMYLLHHEEIESLALNIPGIKRIRFFMTFGQSYLTHLKCLENVGMTSMALPYQDLTIMDDCLATGVDYVDTANYEQVETEKMEYKREYDFPEVGMKDMYLIHHEEIESLALNIPGIKRIRFFMTFGQSYLTHLKCLENVGMTSIEPIMYEGKEIVPLQFLKAVLPDPASLGPRTKGKTNIGCIFTGKKDGKEKTIYIYNVCHHEEIESLALNIPGIKRIRFFMTFGQSYLTHLKCLENVGMTSIEPIMYEGKEIVPLQFLKAVLPDPASLGPRTKGKTNIGCIFTGKKDGKEKTIYIYNVCDHEECYKEVGSQAVAYTTGVPAMIGAMMLMTKTWDKDGVYNIEL